MNDSTSTIAQTVFEDLARRIIAGEFRSGQLLPSERELAAEYHTNRGTLREAIRRLEQMQLVAVRERRGAQVIDFRTEGSLELLTMFLEHGTNVAERVRVILDLLAVRLNLLDTAISLACQRATEDDLEKLRHLGEAQVRAVQAHDRAGTIRGDGAWIWALIDACHSQAVRWMANPLLKTYVDVSSRYPALWGAGMDYGKFIAGTTNALRQRDSETARRLARDYHEQHDARIGELLEAFLALTASSAPARTDAD